MASGIFEHAGIAAISLVYVAVTLFVNKKWGGRDRLKQIQAQMQEYQKEMKKAADSGDDAQLKRLQAREAELTPLMTEMMILPLKSMVLILPLFFIFIGTNGFLGLQYDGIVPAAFAGFQTTLPFNIHAEAVFSWNLLSNIPQQSSYGARGFFIVAAIVWGLCLEAVVSKLEKRGQLPAPKTQA
ncbi:MAG: EMC3/TMCO1 family protein [Candidatus Micrarchaeota archaeon]